MQSELLIAVLAGFGSMLGWGIADFFAKKTIDKLGDIVTLFWCQLLGVIPLLILFIFNPSFPTLSKGEIPFLVLLGVWSGLAYIPTYTAFGKGKVSLLSPIFATYALVVSLLSAIFFKEIIPFGRQIAFLVIFLGVIIMNGNPKSFLFFLKKENQENTGKIGGLKEIIIAVFAFSVWIIALDFFLQGRNWIPFLLAIRIFSSMGLFIYMKFKKITFQVSDKTLWKFLGLIGLFDVFAFASLSYGLSHTSYTSIVAMLGAIFSLPTIVLARIFLKERTTTIQTLGSIVIIIGIVLIYLL